MHLKIIFAAFVGYNQMDLLGTDMLMYDVLILGNRLYSFILNLAGIFILFKIIFLFTLV